MNLGDKTFNLRKEKGLSQEALAELLGTTRQAVSKWENNQGYPEMEKLLQLSNVFEVSTDFLLKDEKQKKDSDEKGYYVSREMARGYLAHEKRNSRYVGLGFMFWALVGIPYVMFSENTGWRLLGMAVCILIGIGFVISAVFAEQDDYKILKQEPLLFDYDFLKELSGEYDFVRKKYSAVAILCTVLFVAGILLLAGTVRGRVEWSEYHAFVFLGLAAGLLGFVCFTGTTEAYELLVKNEQYSSRILFKLRRRVKERLEQL